jgi:hypothetical protein
MWRRYEQQNEYMKELKCFWKVKQEISRILDVSYCCQFLFYSTEVKIRLNK